MREEKSEQKTEKNIERTMKREVTGTTELHSIGKLTNQQKIEH